MIKRSSLKWPIILGTTLLVLIVVLLVFWIISQATSQQYVLLAVGIVFFTLIIAGVSLYLVLSIKEVRLTQRQANFIDSVTHELKSPLASLKLYLQTMTMREVEPEQRRQFHGYMLEDVKRLDALIDDLLEAAKLDQRHREEPLEDLDPLPILKKCAETIERRYELPGSCIQIDAELCVVRGRQHDLELIFTNVFDNAIKYGGSPPKIICEITSKTRTRILIKISDNGPGIPSEMRRKIFLRFVRGGSELERRTKGMGLGLFLVKEFVIKLGGRIHVHGRGPLSGATFEIELPGRAGDLAPVRANT